MTCQEYINYMIENGLIGPYGSTGFPNGNHALQILQETDMKSKTIKAHWELDKKSLNQALEFYSTLGSKFIYGKMLCRSMNTNQYINECIRTLNYFSNVTVYSGGKVLYHGDSVYTLLDQLGIRPDQLDQRIIGRAFYRNTFVSTSNKRYIASGFTSNYNWPVIWRIEVPNAFCGIHRTNGSYCDEDEYLLSPLTVFKVTNISKHRGENIIDLRIIGYCHNGKAIRAEQNAAGFIKLNEDAKRNRRIVREDTLRLNVKNFGHYDKNLAKLNGLEKGILTFLSRINIEAQPFDLQDTSDVYLSIQTSILTNSFYKGVPMTIIQGIRGKDEYTYDYYISVSDVEWDIVNETFCEINVDIRIQREDSILKDTVKKFLTKLYHAQKMGIITND